MKEGPMKTSILLLIYIFTLSAQAAELYIPIGQSQSLAVRPDQNVKIKGKDIVSARLLDKHLILTGKKLGVAQVDIADSNYKIFVVEKNQNELLKAFHLKISQMLGLRAEMRDGLPAIMGSLHRLEDWKILANTAEEYAQPYKMLAVPDSDVQENAKKWIQQILATNNLPLPHLLWSPHWQAIISTEHQSLASLYNQLLSPLGIEIKYEKSQLAIEPLVRVRIVVAEVNKKLQSQFGIEWPNMISAQVAPSFKGPTSLEIFLKAMEQNGLGQILASPNLLARSGGEADFLAGGEFGIKIISRQTKDVIWKKHGIYLKIKPKADRLGRLSIELATEVSLLDQSQTVDGIPGLKTNRMATQFDLQSSQTIVLSGLIRNDWGQNENGITGLSQIPIIGEIFKSQEFTSSRSELIIFVTPEIVTEKLDSEKNLLPKGWVHNG